MAKWFHTRVREARERGDMSQAELGDELGVSAATISNWENRATEPWDEQRERVMTWLERAESKKGRPRKTREDGDDDASGDGDAAFASLEAVYEEWPQSRIAEALSVSQATVSNWLRTRNINPKYFEALKRLASQLAGPEGKKAAEGGVRADAREDATPYAEWLRRELERSGLNAVELAQKSGVHVNTVLALLEGRTERPQQRTRERIETALQIKEEATASPGVEEDAAWYYIGLAWNNDEIEQAPDEPGVYMIHDRLGRPAYIGVAHKGAGGIRGRLKEHNKLRWTSDPRVAFSFSYALTSRMPSADPSQLARAIEKLLIKFMGNAILINEKDVENIRG